ncbi:hypothetical protein [Roseibium sp. RKSG952]|uniref:hypothetical protein n=1 Tax=Roseibium sp. RKSG952 TaxID=2529384 RepID=UPI0012BD606E|nr:hypothetical protein [Roseibium sp. RKSG952]MTI03698.1 hypothetical protein [Roseibium sp. RKSG952]
MNKNNAGKTRDQRGCAPRRRDHHETKLHSGQATPICGHELLPPKTLRQVGKKVAYHGGFRLGSGSERYRKMSAVVAEMAAEVGYDLYRPGKKKAAQFLLGLPDNEYLAICYPAFKHDKRLPSVALVDTTQTAANLQYLYETKVCGRAQLAALTFPALGGRVSIDGYEAGVALAFKRMNKLKIALKNSGLGDFVYVQLEAPFQSETETFYLHFHIFLTFDLGEVHRQRALAFIKENTPWLQSKAGVCLKCIAHQDVAQFVRYGTKPSKTAYEIAASKNKKVFEAYLTVSKGRRLTRTEGSLKETVQELKAQGRRTKFSQCETTGRLSVCLVEKHGVREPEATAQVDLKGGREQDTLKPKAGGKANNAYCGCGRPVAAPDGRLVAFGYVQDFCDSNFDPGSGRGVPGSLFEANRIARHAWEMNTGKAFDLKEFLAPLANDIERLLRDADVQSYTVIASPNVLNTLREILNERKQRLKTQKTVHRGRFGRKDIARKPGRWVPSMAPILNWFKGFINRISGTNTRPSSSTAANQN